MNYPPAYGVPQLGMHYGMQGLSPLMNKFDPEKYVFVAFFKRDLNNQQQEKFLRGNGFEIIVEMDPLMAMAEPESKGKGIMY
jgi:hypothetical protein